MRSLSNSPFRVAFIDYVGVTRTRTSTPTEVSVIWRSIIWWMLVRSWCWAHNRTRIGRAFPADPAVPRAFGALDHIGRIRFEFWTPVAPTQSQSTFHPRASVGTLASHPMQQAPVVSSNRLTLDRPPSRLTAGSTDFAGAAALVNRVASPKWISAP